MSDAAATVAWPRRIPWLAVAVTLIVLLSAAFPTGALRDAVTLGPVGEGRLDRSAAYLAMAPLSNFLDTITLLTIGQHVALLVTAILLFAGYRVVRARRRPGTTGVVREVVAAVSLLACLVLVYLAAVLLPRPMARFVASDPFILAADFHAHTRYSHDGRSGWTEDHVRRWERDAGIDVAYVTDHRTFEGAERGIASNPAQAGQGTMLLQGLETGYRGEHVNVLGAGRYYRGITTPDLRNVDEQSLALMSLIPAAAPVIIETLVGNLDSVPAAHDGQPGVVAIEVVDGSPRGLGQSRAHRERIVQLADSLDLALVTGSDNHGWGRAAAAWTLLRVPGWRGMSHDSLSQRIERILREGRREATRPIERTIAPGTSPILLGLTVPLVTWHMFTTLGSDERVVWLIWTWGLVLLLAAARRYRSARGARA